MPHARPHRARGFSTQGRGRPFCCEGCDAGHGATRALRSDRHRGWDREFPRCPITNDHMNCGSRFPPKRKRSLPILAARLTLKLAAALVRQAAIPSREIGALSRRRSLTGRAGAHPFSTPYSVEQATLIRGHGRGAGSSTRGLPGLPRAKCGLSNFRLIRQPEPLAVMISPC